MEYGILYPNYAPFDVQLGKRDSHISILPSNMPKYSNTVFIRDFFFLKRN